jgi:hypothetical protein
MRDAPPGLAIANGSAAGMTNRLSSSSLASLRAAGASDRVELWVGEAGGIAGGGVVEFTDGWVSLFS